MIFKNDFFKKSKKLGVKSEIFQNITYNNKIIITFDSILIK